MPDGSSNAFKFEKAVRRQTAAIIGLAGPSGGGKTWTALELATGMAGDGRIALISTEGKRDLYYADHFDFDRVGLEAPYTPDRCLDALKAAQDAGYGVVIFDSFSDEYIGEGGLADMAEAERAKMRQPNEAAKWARPKAAHKKVIRWIRNSARCHLIFAMRAEEKVKLVKVMKDGKEQTVVEPIGFQPICERNFMFDMMESALLLPTMSDREGKVILEDARGVPQWIKPMEQHRRFFPDRQPITRESGRLLAEWCAGGISLEPSRDVEGDLREAAAKGKDSLQAAWSSLSREERRPFGYLIGTRDEPGELTLLAREADVQREEPPDEIPFDESPPAERASSPPSPPEREDMDTPPADLAQPGLALGGEENLTVPYDPRQPAFFARQMEALIAEAPADFARTARIKLANENSIAKLKKADTAAYDKLQLALSGRA